jgi:hypothetical protein
MALASCWGQMAMDKKIELNGLRKMSKLGLKPT